MPSVFEIRGLLQTALIVTRITRDNEKNQLNMSSHSDNYRRTVVISQRPHANDNQRHYVFVGRTDGLKIAIRSKVRRGRARIRDKKTLGASIGGRRSLEYRFERKSKITIGVADTLVVIRSHSTLSLFRTRPRHRIYVATTNERRRDANVRRARARRTPKSPFGGDGVFDHCCVRAIVVGRTMSNGPHVTAAATFIRAAVAVGAAPVTPHARSNGRHHAQ